MQLILRRRENISFPCFVTNFVSSLWEIVLVSDLQYYSLCKYDVIIPIENRQLWRHFSETSFANGISISWKICLNVFEVPHSASPASAVTNLKLSWGWKFLQKSNLTKITVNWRHHLKIITSLAEVTDEDLVRMIRGETSAHRYVVYVGCVVADHKIAIQNFFNFTSHVEKLELYCDDLNEAEVVRVLQGTKLVDEVRFVVDFISFYEFLPRTRAVLINELMMSLLNIASQCSFTFYFGLPTTSPQQRLQCVVCTNRESWWISFKKFFSINLH